MSRTSFTKSLMLFNKRVLYNGKLCDDEKTYNLKELKEKLFFNKIFMENMAELFKKYKCDNIIDEYLYCLDEYIHNVNSIIDKMKDLNLFIKKSNIYSFNAEIDMCSQLNSSVYLSNKQIDFNFIDNEIYYITLLNNNHVAISHANAHSIIYNKMLKPIDDMNEAEGNTNFLKADNFIIDYLNSLYKTHSTIAIKVIRNQFGMCKIEYNGNGRDMVKVTELFPSNVLVFKNPWIFIDDIDLAIKSIIEPELVEIKQNFLNISFDDIFKNDIIIEYPTTSFDVYLQLLSSAANNEDIYAIYISLYRIGNDPSIYNILKKAVNNKIKVYVNIELCASGESINQIWLDKMKNSGINVTTFAKGKLKVHSKLTLFRFKNGKSISQIGTGNYHTQTTMQYTDLSIMTADEDICDQVLNMFHIFSGKVKNVIFNNNLLVTRYNAREEIIKLIKRETKLGKNGYITIKCNALDDEEISKYLDKAAKNNCQIDLVIRGVCTWIPDQLGYNVRIKSVVWDKLEHSRIYCFGYNNPTIYIGSLDLVTNKLDRRIETLVKILDPDILTDLCDYLNHYVSNNTNSWKLLRSGEYRKEEI